jgi:hypothetical protein
MLGNLKKVMIISLRADKMLTKHFQITCSQLKLRINSHYKALIF